jgi:hypothetical protein
MPKLTTRVARTNIAAAGVAALAACVLVGVAPAAGTSAVPTGSDRALTDMAELVVATAPFHDVDKALAAGRTATSACIDYPDGFHGEAPGAMGNHFYNVAALTDGGTIDPAQPELLLYEKRPDGSWRFNAIEYVIPAKDLPGTAEPPVLFGQEFKFYPEVGAAGIWGLHVWLWRHNPRGLFVNLHPDVTCAYNDM